MATLSGKPAVTVNIPSRKAGGAGGQPPKKPFGPPSRAHEAEGRSRRERWLAAVERNRRTEKKVSFKAYLETFRHRAT